MQAKPLAHPRVRPSSYARTTAARLVQIVCLGASALAPWHAGAQALTDAQRDALEQRRLQERSAQERQLLECTPDVRTPTTTGTSTLLPVGEQPCFAITQITLAGDEAARFNWVLGALAGPQGRDNPLNQCIGAQGVSVLLQRAQEAVIAKGFVTTRVLAQPQDLSTGTLTLTVVPGRIRHVGFNGSTDAHNAVATALPARTGDILNLRDIEQALENFKRVPTADADIQIAPAAELPNYSDLVIRYQSSTPLRASFSLDDSGSKSTGRYQASTTLSWDNPLGLNDLFYITRSNDAGGGDPGSRGTQGITVHYSVPVEYWTFGVTAGDSRYHQTVSGINQRYVYSGTSGNAELKASYLFHRDATRKSTVSLKAFERHSNNFVDDTEVQIQRRAVGGWELGLGHKAFLGTATLEANVAYKRGTRDFAAIDAPEESTGQGTARFSLWTADLTYSHPFKAWSQALRYQSTLRLQGTETALTPQDRFGIGGRYTVRGFDGESSLAGDEGWLLRQDIGWALGDSGQELYLGVDAGGVKGQSTEFLAGKTLTGAVLGLRGGYRKLQYDLFVGAPLYQPSGFKTAETTAGFSLNLSF